ncbi:nuclear transport factor 2 family protein [Gayadomonas joobiniege]|uniref:nuclear transport factor 2 family protein n=1 Tax=Gayadomonas joobiniege TaxID=1234606 RepID=UPI000371171A|nr:nuclear transport factor 2 family protein [Gayadomonas joobiniege]
MVQSHRVNYFFSVYQSLSYETLEQLNLIYSDHIEFIDPLHHIQGRDQLRRYFAYMYKNTISSEFSQGSVVEIQDTAVIEWTMRIKHKSLNNGKQIAVDGISKLIFEGDKVVFHRDYFDLSQFLFDQLPVVRRISRYVKNKAAKY